jgi:hypothetical protein
MCFLNKTLNKGGMPQSVSQSVPGYASYVRRLCAACAPSRPPTPECLTVSVSRMFVATIRFPLTLHRRTCLSSAKMSEESHNLHSGEPSRIRSKNIGTSLGKSSVQLKSYYARAHKTRCWLFADWLAHGAPSKLDGAPRAFPFRERPDKKNCSAVRPSDRARDRAPTPDN